MNILASIALAFGMYSRIPLSMVAWEASTMRYVLGALPLVGLVQGVVVVGVGAIAMALELPQPLCALLMVMTPILFNGGIHLDGLCDTADALASHAPAEKKLLILKDPHAGAFGVMALVCYVIALFALFSVLDLSYETLGSLGCLYVLSRALVAGAIMVWPNANAQGTAGGFKAKSAPRATLVILGCTVVLAGAALVALQGVWGLIIPVVVVGVLVWFYFRVMRLFGGMTGDLAGYVLQVLELAMLVVLVGGGLVR